MTPKEASEKLLEKVESASPEEVQALLNAGADPNARDSDGNTALIKAATENENHEVVKVLLAAGANPNIKAKEGGETALMWAAWRSNSKMVQALLEAGANPNAKNKSNETALMWAADYVVSSEVLKALLDAGADPNARDRDGNTALMWVAEKHSGDDNDAYFKLLLAAGADPKVKDKDGETVATLELKSWKLNVIRECLEDMYKVIDKKTSLNSKYDLPRRRLKHILNEYMELMDDLLIASDGEICALLQEMPELCEGLFRKYEQ